MQYPHNCIKCGEKYSDEDPDAYLCATCLEARKVIAAQVDRTMAALPRKAVKSLLQEYEAAPKVAGRFQILKLSDL